MYIKAYSEPMPYSEIFRTIDISSLFQARYSGINQEQFWHILSLVQADSGIVRTLAYLGTNCFRHIQAYSRSYIPGYIYLGIFVRILAYFSISKCIQQSCTNTCCSSQVLLLNHCSNIFGISFSFFFQSWHSIYFVLQNKISMITKTRMLTYNLR